MISGATRVFGLIGHPVARSLSPAMHNRWFQETGFDGVYVTFDVAPDRSTAIRGALDTLNISGANVTVPHKSTLIDRLDSSTAMAQGVGAVNVVVRDGARWIGHNVDGAGFCSGFEAEFGALHGRRVAVMGVGGAGRAVAAACALYGAERLGLFTRDVSRAADFRERASSLWPTARWDVASVDEPLAGFDIVIWASSLAAPALDLGRCGPDVIACDLNYWDASSALLGAARHQGVRTQDGLPMLVHQGALSYELFTGLRVDPAPVLASFL